MCFDRVSRVKLLNSYACTRIQSDCVSIGNRIVFYTVSTQNGFRRFFAYCERIRYGAFVFVNPSDDAVKLAAMRQVPDVFAVALR